HPRGFSVDPIFPEPSTVLRAAISKSAARQSHGGTIFMRHLHLFKFGETKPTIHGRKRRWRRTKSLGPSLKPRERISKNANRTQGGRSKMIRKFAADLAKTARGGSIPPTESRFSGLDCLAFCYTEVAVNTSFFFVRSIAVTLMLVGLAGCADTLTYSKDSRATGLRLMQEKQYPDAAGAFHNGV